MHPRIADVRVDRPHVVRLTFADGSQGSVDLAPHILGRGEMFVPLADPEYFRRVRVDKESGTIVWPNGLDLDPDVLYELAHGESALT